MRKLLLMLMLSFATQTPTQRLCSTEDAFKEISEPANFSTQSLGQQQSSISNTQILFDHSPLAMTSLLDAIPEAFQMGKLFDRKGEQVEITSLSEPHCGCKHPKQGPRGPTGPQGPTGPTGPAGPPFSSSFLSVFLTINPPGGVSPGGFVPFNQPAIGTLGTEGPAMTYNPGNPGAGIIFNATGFYEVTFGASMSISNDGAGGLTLQMTPAGVYPFPGFVPGSEIDISSADQMTSLSVIIQVTQVGQVLQLVNGNISAFINFHAENANTNLTPVLAYLVIAQLQ